MTPVLAAVERNIKSAAGRMHKLLRIRQDKLCKLTRDIYGEKVKFSTLLFS